MSMFTEEGSGNKHIVSTMHDTTHKHKHDPNQSDNDIP